MGFVVRAVGILSIPASEMICVSKISFSRLEKRGGKVLETHVGNVIVARIPPPHISAGRVVVSFPVHGGPPNGSWARLLKQRWQSCFCSVCPDRNMGSPTIIRNPYSWVNSNLNISCKVLTGLKAVTLVTPSYGGI
jgi:hypothetical protein